MKVLMLGDPASAHIIKWANSLADKGVDLFVAGFSSYNKEAYRASVKIETLIASQKVKNKPDGNFLKATYLAGLARIKSIIKEYRPNIVHSHYASSYGLIGALANFHPYIISVWGSDVYNFPRRSVVHKKILTYSLSKADLICSTSNVMASHTKNFTDKKINVIPFGIDTELFKPINDIPKEDQHQIAVGTIKTLEKKYGVDFLIKSFALVRDKHRILPLKLFIVGDGSQRKELSNLIRDLGIENDCYFTGYVLPSEIPEYHNKLDVYVSLSIDDSESFGVAILEASSCGKPVIVSNVGGLPEVVENDVTGIIVEPKNVEQAAAAIEKLILNEELRRNLGINGRKRVIEKYNWNNNVEQMISVYKSFLPAN